jgi:predicted nucleic acid-binding protein
MDRRFDTADALVASGPAFALGDPMRLCRDPNDDRLLELARVGKASYLVTGDRDLLVLDSFHETRIVSPAMFLAVVRV